GVEGLKIFGSPKHVPRVVIPHDLVPHNPVGPVVSVVGRHLSGLASWAVSLGLVAIVLATMLLALPHAEVRVQPITDELGSTVQVTASVSAAAPDPIKGILPSRQVYLLVPQSGTVSIQSADHPL